MATKKPKVKRAAKAALVSADMDQLLGNGPFDYTVNVPRAEAAHKRELAKRLRTAAARVEPEDAELAFDLGCAAMCAELVADQLIEFAGKKKKGRPAAAKPNHVAHVFWARRLGESETYQDALGFTADFFGMSTTGIEDSLKRADPTHIEWLHEIFRPREPGP
jgi:hypothetical protein